ncbi:hypothetical protein [Knoellia sinensis]|uniref:hypothetical protein n=1 Tax=Knoellia sinensis TaxID=136100 RepID=UPI000AC36E08|nr:hypothetical protein [Knoellia sinensis]
MQPSSLIFLVIIGIWAAYFVQYWVRRREHLATIRSVDAFSETMRVLERRAPLPSVEGSGQSPRTYAVSPARAVRPQVTVKRAEAHVAASVNPSSRDDIADDVVEPEVATMHPSRATRGTVVLVGLVGTLVFAVLAAFGVLLWWSFAVPLAMAVGGLVWLRAGVQAEISARRAVRRPVRRVPVAEPVRETAAGDDEVAERIDHAAPAPAPASRVSAREFELAQEVLAASVPEDAPFDVSAPAVPATAAVEAREAASAEHGTAAAHVEAPVEAVQQFALPEVDEDDIPLTWDPRPVPRPTYTMKAKAADRPAPTAQPEPAAEAEWPAYDEVPERRIVGG